MDDLVLTDKIRQDDVVSLLTLGYKTTHVLASFHLLALWNASCVL